MLEAEIGTPLPPEVATAYIPHSAAMTRLRHSEHPLDLGGNISNPNVIDFLRRIVRKFIG